MKGNIHWLVAIAVIVAIVVATPVLLGQIVNTSASQWRVSSVWAGVVPGEMTEGVFGNSSRIAGIYLMRYGSGYNIYENLANYVDNGTYWIDSIPGPDGTLTVEYETLFDILVAVEGDAENDVPQPMAYACKENIKIQILLTGEITYSDNSTDLVEYVFENDNYYQTNGGIHVNALFDNNGNGWVVRAGQSFNWSISYSVWG